MSEFIKGDPKQSAEYLQERIAEDVQEMEQLFAREAQLTRNDTDELARVHAAMDVIQKRHAFTLEKWKELVQGAPHRAKPDLHLVPSEEETDNNDAQVA